MVFQLLRDVFYIFISSSFTSIHVCCFVMIAGFLLPVYSHAGKIQTFDLDINELKNRTNPSTAAPLPAASKSALQAKPENDTRLYTHKPKKNRLKNNVKPNISNSEQLIITVPSEEKLLLLKALPSPDSIPTPSPSRTIALQDSVPPCELVTKILASFFSPIPTAEALQGVPLAAPYAVRGNKVIAAIACGLAEAEEMTFTRLLAAHGTRLINIIGNDSPETITNKVAGTLGFSSQTLRAGSDDIRLIYIFPDGSEKETGIFISLADKTISGNNPNSGSALK